MDSGLVVEAVGAVETAADGLLDTDVSELGASALLRRTRQLEVARRKLDAAAIQLAGQVEANGAHSLDGHHNAISGIKHLGRLSGADAAARVKSARALRRLPLVAKAFREGLIPTGHIAILGRAGANPRVDGWFEEFDEWFRAKACVQDHDTFAAEVEAWVATVDTDGAEQDAERAHRRRNFRCDRDFDGNYVIKGSEGALRGAMIAMVLAAFTQAELEADWADARQRLGDAATKNDLARTPAQRRADAMFKIIRIAAANPAAGTVVPNVDIIIDEETFETEIARQASADRNERPAHDPTRAGVRVCRTADGVTLTPAEALMAAIVGTVRAIVIDAEGNVINHGRAKRFFTGNSRHAVLLRDAIRNASGVTCIWPGCDVPGCRCQIDHREPVRERGPTDHSNAEPACGWHNRLKETGFHPVSNGDGTYTIHRPDGTPITPSV